MLRLVTSGFLLFAVALVAHAQGKEKEDKTFEGTWTNKQFGTSGTMKCVAQSEKDGNWKATFSGVFRGRRFSYDVTFKAKTGKAQEDLSGNATISGAKYQWKGVMKGDTLTGKYSADNGYYGDFVLKAPKKKE